MLALGRSSILFDTIVHLAGKGATFQLIVTSAANAEYERGADDFEALAKQVGSEFVCLRSQDEMGEIGSRVQRLGIEEG